jgi:hypothetical protein
MLTFLKLFSYKPGVELDDPYGELVEDAPLLPRHVCADSELTAFKQKKPASLSNGDDDNNNEYDGEAAFGVTEYVDHPAGFTDGVVACGHYFKSAGGPDVRKTHNHSST